MSRISDTIHKTTQNNFVHLDDEVVAKLPKPTMIDLSKKEKIDYVNHPSHYATVDPAYEPIKVINAWELDFNIGNAVKYLARYKKKWNPVEDLKKAVFYINDEIARLEKNSTNAS